MSEIIFSKEYCSNVFDGTHDSPKPCEIGVPLITSKNIVNGCLDFNGAYNISLEDYNKIQKRSAVSKWDILFSMIGSVGEVYLEKNDNINYAIKNVGVLSCKDEYKAKWLYYYLKTPFAKSYIKYSLAGAVQKFLSLGKLRDFPIFQYDITKNKNLDFLSALDDKIELNNRINAELEAMAKTLYDYWFVQFDFPNSPPSEGWQNSKNFDGVVGYKSSGGKMVYNETLKREIPEGWEASNLEKIAKLVRGVSYNKGDIEEKLKSDNIRILRATNITGNQLDLENPIIVSKKFVNEEQILNKFDILMTMSSGSIDHIGKNAFYYFEEKVSFGAFCAKLKANENFRYFLYLFMQSPFVNATIKNECLGTNINNLNGTMVNSFKTIIPDKNILEKFNQIVEPLFDKIGNNLKQNQELSALRDWLLPMLMNGQVKVG